MGEMTEEEWNKVQGALVHGGLRAIIDEMIRSRMPDNAPISDVNRMLLYRAYDDGDGNTISLVPGEIEGYFSGMWEDEEVVCGIEIAGVLYSICRLSATDFAVYVGSEIVENAAGAVFRTVAEAKAYILGLTAK